MSADLKMILNVYIDGIKAIYGDSLKKVILYGSYARGDFRADSDVDIMVLVDLEEEEILQLRDQLYDMTYDFWWKYDIDINPIVKNDTHFMKWVQSYPFYGNVQKEGVELYAA